MPTLIAIAFAGFIAQLVDGSLGMGYGVTSTTLLLTLGLRPALASASVHLAEIGTSGVSGFSHWRSATSTAACSCSIGIPGGVGAFLGRGRALEPVARRGAADGLARAPRARRRDPVPVHPWPAGRRGPRGDRGRRRPRRRRPAPASGPRRWALVPLGLVGGFLDASGGGGWGPVTTSSLMAVEPDAAAQDHRHRQRLGVHRLDRRQPRVPARARVGRHRPRDRRDDAARRRDRRAALGVAREPVERPGARHGRRRR